MVLNIASFGPAAAFAERMESVVAEIKGVGDEKRGGRMEGAFGAWQSNFPMI